MRDDLIREYEIALNEQLEAKRMLFDAEHHYDKVRAKIYLSHGDKMPHYKATAMTTATPMVIDARTALDEAKLAHYKAWTRSHLLNRQLGGIDMDTWQSNRASGDSEG
jgi:hypothetical protein